MTAATVAAGVVVVAVDCNKESSVDAAAVTTTTKMKTKIMAGINVGKRRPFEAHDCRHGIRSRRRDGRDRPAARGGA